MHKPTILIIAGGKNSRFFPLNTKTHKGFISLVGKPIIERALENLKKHNLTNVVIVLSDKDYNNKDITKYLTENNLGLDIKLVLQKEANGMGDAILAAREHLNHNFIVAFPYYQNLGAKIELLINKKQVGYRAVSSKIEDDRASNGNTNNIETDNTTTNITNKNNNTKINCVFSGTETDTPEIYGILDIDTNNPEKLLGLIEKPKKGSKNSSIKVDGIYLLDREFIDELFQTPEEEYSFETAISTYAKKAEIAWIKNTLEIKSIKYPWHLFSTFKQIISTEQTTISTNADIANTAIIDNTNGPVIIDDYARVGDFTKIVGPCYVGKNCLVGDYSFVRESSLEEGAVVGANTEVVRSIILEKSSIHFGYLADSILGHNTKIGAGLITANKRLDKENIKVMIKNKLIDTGVNTLGIITGENVSIGIRVNTMPGIIIGAEADIYPSVTVARNVKEDQILK